MAIKLPITATTDQRMGLIFFKLMQLSGIVNRTRETDIIVDLTDSRFLHAIYLSGLFSLMRAWQYEGKNIIIESKHTGLSSYLKTICFEKGFVLDDKPNAIKSLFKIHSLGFLMAIFGGNCVGFFAIGWAMAAKSALLPRKNCH